MTLRPLLALAAASALLCLLSIAGVDRPVALWIQSLGGAPSPFFAAGVTAIETVSGWGFSKRSPVYVLLLAGALLWSRKAWRAGGNLLLLTALSHELSRLTAGILKNVFDRLRPYEVLAQGDWDAAFFVAGGHSFPSGHVAYFCGLFLPLAWAFPRYRLPLLAVPAYIVVARVAVNDHFVSDVLGSVAIAALLTAACIKLFTSFTMLKPWTRMELRAPPPLNVLVLCTGNSARSILAEALINHLGRGRFRAYSAGSKPAGKVNPLALRVLQEQRVPVESARSKSWDEFAGPAAPKMDLVITVCDNAAGVIEKELLSPALAPGAAPGETCPLWPGTPVKVHWGLPDPAAVTGGEEQRLHAFREVYRMLETRVRRLVALRDPLHENRQLEAELRRIHLEVQ